MEFTNEFTVPTSVDETWSLLTDLERVAPCLPGAELDDVDGGVYSGRVKVKVGPMTMTYRGTAQLVEADRDSGTARIGAAGREMKGGGSAKADITANLASQDGQTLVRVVTDLVITGKPAQFGRGVLADVGTKIIGEFAERLEKLVTEQGAASEDGRDAGGSGEAGDAGRSTSEDAPVPAEDASGGADAAGTGTSAPEDAGASERAESNEALDLMEYARGAAIKRLVPLAVGVVVVALAIWWLVS